MNLYFALDTTKTKLGTFSFLQPKLKGYKEPTLILDAIKAAQNAEALKLQIHRYNPAMSALARCILEKSLEGSITKGDNLVNFWNDVALINADRSVR